MNNAYIHILLFKLVGQQIATKSSKDKQDLSMKHE